MKNRLIIIFLFVVLLSIQSFAQSDSSLESLYRNKQFFDLRNEIAKQSDVKSPEMLFYHGVVANKFNQLQ